jgi:diguanylate cyclase (GGDEF)-like protein
MWRRSFRYEFGMHFDLPTLMAAGSFVAGLSAVFVFYAWTHGHDGRSLVWWAAGDVVYAVSVGLMTLAVLPGAMALMPIGAALMNVAPALFWVSSRLFNGRRIPTLPVVAGVALSVFVVADPHVASSQGLGMSLTLSIFTAFALATAWEFWRGGADGLKARRPLVALCLLQAAVFVAGVIEAATGRITDGAPVPLASWFGLIHFVSIIYLLGTAVFIVALSRERGERRQKDAAETDALTGVANRGAFMVRAGKALKRSLEGDLPLSIIIFDLDHFKLVNDNFGHAVGDAVLRRFGETVRSVLRANDFAGRIGGEEFAVILPDTSLGAAFVVAERIRATFEADCRSIDGRSVNATVSAGVTTAHPHSTVDSILVSADLGLYQAKQNGRNRVERPKPARNGDDGPFLERVA